MKIIGSYLKSHDLFKKSVNLSQNWMSKYYPGLKRGSDGIEKVQAFSENNYFSAFLLREFIKKNYGINTFVNDIWERYPTFSEIRKSDLPFVLVTRPYRILKSLSAPKINSPKLGGVEILFVSSGRHLDDFLKLARFLSRAYKVLIVGKISMETQRSLMRNNINFINIADPKLYFSRIDRFKNFLRCVFAKASADIKEDDIFRNRLWLQRIWYLKLFEFPEIIALIKIASKIVAGGKPRLVLTSSSNDTFGSTFALAARNMDVPVAEIIHGFAAWDIQSPFSNSDYQLVWSKPSAQIRSKFSKETVVVGCPFLDKPKLIKSKVILDKKTVKILVLITPPFGLVTLFQSILNKDMAKALIEGLRCLPSKFEIIIRSHPAYNFLDDVKDIRIPSNIKLRNERKIEDEIYDSDLVITQPTTAGFLAILQKKPLMFFDNTHFTEQFSHPFVKSGSAVNVPLANLEKIDQYVLRLISNHDVLYKQRLAQEKFIREYCSYFGEESCDKISKFVERIIKDKNKTSN